MEKDKDNKFIEPSCSFCGKPESKVAHLIAAPGDNIYICDDCVEVCKHQLEVVPTATPDAVSLIPPEKMKEELDKYIIGQDEAKRVLSVAVYNHYKRVNYNLRNMRRRNVDDERSYSEITKADDGVELNKSNILMFGPSGCGKTLLAQTLSKILKVPFAMVDATTLTEAGYVGEDVENILLRLLKNADYDVAAAERGIIYVDEVDKIARKSENVSITRDVSGEGVQQALLKIIESTVSNIPPNGGRKHPQQEFVHMDTTNVLFILGGAFVGLDKIVFERLGKSRIGFGGVLRSDNVDADTVLPQVQPQDLIKFGLIPELVGRVPVTVSLKELKSEDLVRVLTEPKNALVKQYKKLLDLDGVELEFDSTALVAIADKAIALHTGARGLRTIVENAMLDIMYKVPSDKTIEKIIISADTIQNGTPPQVIKKAA